MVSEKQTQVWSIGIDLGTTHCALSYRRPAVRRLSCYQCLSLLKKGSMRHQSFCRRSGYSQKTNAPP